MREIEEKPVGRNHCGVMIRQWLGGGGRGGDSNNPEYCIYFHKVASGFSGWEWSPEQITFQSCGPNAQRLNKVTTIMVHQSLQKITKFS